MAWTSPANWPVGFVVTSSFLHAQIRDNLLELRGGGLSLPGQVANRVPYASTSTQFTTAANFVFDGLSFGFGGPIYGYSQFRFGDGTSVFAAPGTADNVYGMLYQPKIQAGAGKDAHGMNCAPVLVNASGTGSLFTGAKFDAPIITITAGVVSTAATVYISGAPTGATNNYALRINSGLVSVGGFGQHIFSAGGTGEMALYVRNTNGGAANYALLGLGNDVALAQGSLLQTSSTYTPAIYYRADCLAIVSGGAGGMSIATPHASGYIGFYTGGTSEAMRIHASRGVSIGDATDPGATNFRVAGNATIVGALLASAGGNTSPSIAFAADTDTGWYNNAGTGNMRLALNGVEAFYVLDKSATRGYVINLASGAFGAGAVQGSNMYIGNNTSGNGAPGSLTLYTKNTLVYSLFVDSSGLVRVNGGSPPTESGGDTIGTVVGTQTSSLDTKDLLGDAITPGDALTTILRTPIHKFRYKDNRYNRTRFHGIIADYSPEFAMDPDDDHPKGRSFNPVSAFGYTVQAFKALEARISYLESQLKGY